ncbi:pyrroline-5-carboxylate reductase [Candidatus Peregrinibacteria bacterium CG11_big_fil_rev_8_21_14_0_20_46_8]|nr:MAG: pyrroline-5-carboxylate reductase [Candidatus Peregrinibacteria bacterium CG11_big_fil_rev_8_21_14_0_20_46_8]
MKLGIIGAGNMGGAFYKGLAEKLGHEDLYLCDKHNEKMAAIGAKNFYNEPGEMLEKVDAVLIAVKPQAFDELIRQTGAGALTTKLLISMMAAVPIAKISAATDSARVVRIMPNLGVQVGKGVTGWVASNSATEEDQRYVQHMLEAVGEAVQVDDEDGLDRLSVITGCGPAYFFYLTELLTKKARTLGFSEDDARKMAEGTYIGSAALLAAGAEGANDGAAGAAHASRDAEAWRRAVCSKGGVTERAIATFEEHGMEKILNAGVDAALKRSDEMKKM